MAEIFQFPSHRSISSLLDKYDALPDHLKAECTAVVAKRKAANRSTGVNIRTLCFRSYDLIVESDEAELLRDVCLDTHKAEVKLRKVRERLQGERERSTLLIELLTAAETKLSSAIAAALLSTGQR